MDSRIHRTAWPGGRDELPDPSHRVVPVAAGRCRIGSSVHLARLALTDFRCYESADVTLAPGVTTFTGPNGAGKTNLIEAAWYIATFGSHRVAADSPLVRSGAQRAILRAVVTSHSRNTLVEIEV